MSMLSLCPGMKSITLCLHSSQNSPECASVIPATCRANSITLICIPRQIPKYGTLFSLAYLAAFIIPSIPRLPKPPGTIIPSASLSISPVFSSVSFSLSIQLISISVSREYPACRRASATERYASCSFTYFPTRAILTLCRRFSIFLTSSCHSPRSGSGALIFSSRQTTPENPDFSSMSGAMYRFGSVRFSITQSGFTLQNIDILRNIDSSRGSSHLRTIISGLIPIPCSSFTECWVGFDLCSSEPRRNGTSVTCMKRLFPLPSSSAICLAASRNGWDSISPIVPPISVITTSASVCFPTLYTKFFISLVICGIT